MIGNIGLPGLLLLVMVFVFLIFPFWKLLPKFGYSKWLSLLTVIPLVMFIFLWVLAFSEPVKRKEQMA